MNILSIHDTKHVILQYGVDVSDITNLIEKYTFPINWNLIDYIIYNYGPNNHGDPINMRCQS